MTNSSVADKIPVPDSQRHEQSLPLRDDPRRLGIKAMQQLAKSYGGQCLSETYVSASRKLRWQCQEGHIWESTPVHVQRGQWCVKCRKEHLWQQRLEKLQAAAKEKGGECLTSEYNEHRARLTWRCAEGHIWQTRGDTVLGGRWCPVCRYEKMKYSLADLQKMAKMRDGLCLAKQYISSQHKVPWQCSRGHVWETTSNRVQLGHWCPICVHDSMRLSIELMHEIAEERGGICLSEKYTNSNTKLRWQCRYGHVWFAAPGHIRAGKWCPVCARYGHTIEDMQELAEERGGLCLSTEYRGTMHHMIWQCKLGHVWSTTPFTVLRGSWCPQCYYLSMCLHDKARKKYICA